MALEEPMESEAPPAVEASAGEPLARPSAPSWSVDYLPPGLVVNGVWTIEAKLGAGGMGVVYRVHNAQTTPPTLAALKVSMAPPYESEEERVLRLRRFEREFAAVFLLEHPNLLKPTSFFCWPHPTEGHPCFVMPYVRGDSLGAHCLARRPSLRDFLGQLFRPVADALDYIHGKSLFHRDIKPNNIMVRHDGRPVLMDFGLARTCASTTLTRGEVLATYEFGAPEYLAYAASKDSWSNIPFDYTPQADLFCLGGTLLGVLAGRLPYQHIVGAADRSVFFSEAFLAELRSYEPPSLRALNPAVPPEVDALAARLLARRPEDRFPTGAALCDAIDALLAAHPSPDPAFDEPFPYPQRSRASSSRGCSGTGIEAPAGRHAEAGGGAHTSAEDSAGRGRPPREVPLPPPPSGPDSTPPLEVPEAPQVGAAPRQARGADAADDWPAILREAQERLRAASPPTAARSPWLLAGLVVALLVLAGVLAQAAGARRAPAVAERPGPSLIDEVIEGKGERSPLSGGAASAAASSTAPSSSPAVPLPAPVGPAAARRASDDVPPRLRAGPPVAEPTEAQLEALAAAPLRRTGALGVAPGEPRRTSTREADAQAQGTDATAAATTEASPRAGSWVLGAEDEQVATVVGAEERSGRPAGGSRRGLEVHTAGDEVGGGLGSSAGAAAPPAIPLGTEFAARLQRPLDTHTVASGPAVARLTRPVVVRGTVVLPAGTLLFGAASATAAGRFDVRFSRLALPTGEERAFDGIAYDVRDRKPGLRATSRRQLGVGSSSDSSVVERLARSAGGLVVDRAKSTQAEGAAREAADVVLSQAVRAVQPSSAGEARDALLLDAPTDFVVFVASTL